MRKPRKAGGPALRRGQNRCRLVVEELESRQLLSANSPFDPSGAITLHAGVSQFGVIHTTPTLYAVTVADNGRLTAAVAATGGDTRLTLRSADGQILLQSDGISTSDPNDFIDLHVAGETAGTTYYLEVQGLGEPSGSYVVITDFTSANAPGQSLLTETMPFSIATADFSNDENSTSP